MAGRNVVVANNTFTRVARSALDLEPLSTHAFVDGVQLTDNRIENSARFVSALSGVQTPVDDVQVLRNVLVDTPMILNVVSPGFSGTGPSWRRHWTIDGNQSMTLPQGGHIVWLAGVLDLRLTNNRWRVLDRPGPSPGTGRARCAVGDRGQHRDEGLNPPDGRPPSVFPNTHPTLGANRPTIITTRTRDVRRRSHTVPRDPLRSPARYNRSR